MNAAMALRPLVDSAIGTDLPVRIDCWDGSSIGPTDADVVVRFRTRRALRRLVWAPNELGFARAYVSGDVEIEGNLLDGLSRLNALADPREWTRREGGKGHAGRCRPRRGSPRRAGATSATTCGGDSAVRASTREVTRCQGGDPPLRRRERLLRTGAGSLDGVLLRLLRAGALGRVHPRGRATRQARPGGAEAGVGPRDAPSGRGVRLGGFVLHAARQHGVNAVGVTLSEQQAAYARESRASLGLSDRVEIRVQDYRDVRDGPYDAIASIGMAEHVGLSQLGEYAAQLHSLLVPVGGCSTTRSRAGRAHPATHEATRPRSSTDTSSPMVSCIRCRRWSTCSSRQGSRSETWSRCVSTTRTRCVHG